MPIMIFNDFISQEEQEVLYKYVKKHDFKLEDALVLIDNKTKMSHIFLRPFGSDLKDRLYKKMKESRRC